MVLAFSMRPRSLTGLIFGLAPALQAARGHVRTRSRKAAAAFSARFEDGASGGRSRSAQTALALVVLVGAGLLVRSFMALDRARSRLCARAPLLVQCPDYPAARRWGASEAASQLIERLSQVPGIEAVGGRDRARRRHPAAGTRFAVEGRTLTSSQDTALFMAATPGYFTRVADTGAARARDRRDRSSVKANLSSSSIGRWRSSCSRSGDAVASIEDRQPGTVGRLANDRRRRRRRRLCRHSRRRHDPQSTRRSCRRRSSGST